ncbi:magnesium and cobalt efflux protein [Candidatus Rickettsiella viridis]|uniref:Magnesium and cobalt efflux protein CorC n=1 Tax=Candidatus Rickettsiella viridis TaxID=676208 RepID=A0A2Z5UVN1_9COXI|nr:CNNM domain-containing protein [Candidatus Rickettsiella viridis]BBB15676.1 magnesium and cobalt efflux protein [Candidatus Rickettsiella viridis]
MHSLKFLISVLVVLLLCAVFFSLAEAAMLSINRYRLRHLVRHNHYLAKRVQDLLKQPDRLLGVILLCGTFADILAAAVATLIAIQCFGEGSVFFATLALTFVVLVFCEVAPKTLATLYPLPIAFFSVWPLIILLHVLYPFVWITSLIANASLRLFGVKVPKLRVEQLSRDELASLLREGTGHMPRDYQSMLLKVLELEKVTVEDIMIPRQEISGIDINKPWEEILKDLIKSQYTRLPIYRRSIDDIIGILHFRRVLNSLSEQQLSKEVLINAAEEVHFIPEATALNSQLLNFRREKHRIGLVVNEYGEIQGLITLEDILEEIVGEFTTDTALMRRAITLQADGSYLVDGGIALRDLNRQLNYDLPLRGPKTLSGLIIEQLEVIPKIGAVLHLENKRMEVIAVKNNRIKTVKIFPTLLPSSLSKK